MRKITLISLSVLALALLVFAPGAFAGSDKGREVIKRGNLVRWVRETPAAPAPLEET